MTGLPRDFRLRKRKDYLRVQGKSERSQSTHFILLAAKQPGSIEKKARLGITASKKVGNAVARNKVKRGIKEFFRMKREEVLAKDYVIIARKVSALLRSREMNKELDGLFR